MMGRITQGMMNTQLLRNLNNNLYNMSEYQNQMATGRKINKPSDDPVGLSFAMRYRSELNATDQYQENVDSALSWLDFTDSMLGQAGDVIQKVRELAVQGANGSNPASALEAIKEEMLQLTKQLVTIGNSEFNGKHVFNGQITEQTPYTDKIERDPLTNQYVISAKDNWTDYASINFEISTGVKLPVNVTGNDIFGTNSPGDQSVFSVLENIINALDQNNPSAVSGQLDELDVSVNKILQIRADIGAKTNRVQLADERLKDSSINLQSLQSKTEDADVAELITNLKTYENVYQASLSVGSKIISPSLVDFLK